MSASAIPAPTPAERYDALVWAYREGSDREWTMALRDYLLNAALQHSAAAGVPVSDRAAQVIANNVAQGLADLVRPVR